MDYGERYQIAKAMRAMSDKLRQISEKLFDIKNRMDELTEESLSNLEEDPHSVKMITEIQYVLPKLGELAERAEYLVDDLYFESIIGVSPDDLHA